jgi:hydrogenase expression/formation protein HypE
MKIGKLDNDTLERLVLGKIGNIRDEVLTKPGIGEDCAVVDFGEYECVISTDPITATAEEIGRLAIHISCNDVASCGVEPLGVLLTVLLPECTTEEDISRIMSDAADAAKSLNVMIIGGHTEITDAVSKPLISTVALGRCPSGGAEPKYELTPGDEILVTKQLAMEGTAIIAAEKQEELSSFLSTQQIEEAHSLYEQISVVKEGVIAGRIGYSSMHDITEGGVLGAVWEICRLGNVGAYISEKNLPLAYVTKLICEHYKADPLRLISSGAMLITAPPKQATEIIAALEEAGISVSRIGNITGKVMGTLIDGKAIQPPESDEIYKVLSTPERVEK